MKIGQEEFGVEGCEKVKIEVGLEVGESPKVMVESDEEVVVVKT